MIPRIGIPVDTVLTLSGFFKSDGLDVKMEMVGLSNYEFVYFNAIRSYRKILKKSIGIKSI